MFPSHTHQVKISKMNTEVHEIEYYLEQIFEKSQFRTIPHLKCPEGAVL